MEPPASTALTVFRVRVKAELDPERLLDGPLVVEEADDGAILVATADPDAEAKLFAHAAVLGVQQTGKAALVADWIEPKTREALGA